MEFLGAKLPLQITLTARRPYAFHPIRQLGAYRSSKHFFLYPIVDDEFVGQLLSLLLGLPPVLVAAVGVVVAAASVRMAAGAVMAVPVTALAPVSVSVGAGNNAAAAVSVAIGTVVEVTVAAQAVAVGSVVVGKLLVTLPISPLDLAVAAVAVAVEVTGRPCNITYFTVCYSLHIVYKPIFFDLLLILIVTANYYFIIFNVS